MSKEETHSFLNEVKATKDIESNPSDFYGSVANMKNSNTKEDPMVRDKKVVPLSNPITTFPVFLIFLFIVTPIWLTLLLPLTVSYQALAAVCGPVFGKKSKKSIKPESPEDIAQQVIKAASDDNDRIYDVIVFGATGFTGKMAAIYLAKQYGKSIRWAIAGRRREALENVRKDLAKINKDLADLPIVLADSYDTDALNKMTRQTKVIITTTGPFSRYGTPLVKSCVVHGTHYCDITGETDWVREMIDQFDVAARKSGSRIVHFCGHDCIPWDLSVLELSKALKKKGETLSTVNFYDDIQASASGGTLETTVHVLSNRVKYTSFLGFDPLLKSLVGGKSANKFAVQNQFLVGYGAEHNAWTGPFVMSMVMANCVRRSNALNNYASKLSYKEVQSFPSFAAAYISVMGLFVFGTAFFFPPLQWLLRKFVLPKPGEGPSEEFMDSGFLKVTGYGTGSNGSKVKSMIYFPTDPGYRDTARMLVESGLTLALEGQKLKVEGGVFTPAACQGEVLLKRLENTGCTFTIEEL